MTAPETDPTSGTDEYSAVPDVVWCPFVIGSVHPDAHKKIGWPCVEDHQTLYFRTPSSAREVDRG